jgi:hypothetical protein
MHPAGEQELVERAAAFTDVGAGAVEVRAPEAARVAAGDLSAPQRRVAEDDPGHAHEVPHHQAVLGAAVGGIAGRDRLVGPARLSVPRPLDAAGDRVVSHDQHVVGEVDGPVEVPGVVGEVVHGAHLAGVSGGGAVGKVVALVGARGQRRVHLQVRVDGRDLLSGRRALEAVDDELGGEAGRDPQREGQGKEECDDGKA